MHPRVMCSCGRSQPSQVPTPTQDMHTEHKLRSAWCVGTQLHSLGSTEARNSPSCTLQPSCTVLASHRQAWLVPSLCLALGCKFCFQQKNEPTATKAWQKTTIQEKSLLQNVRVTDMVTISTKAMARPQLPSSRQSPTFAFCQMLSPQQCQQS